MGKLGPMGLSRMLARLAGCLAIPTLLLGQAGTRPYNPHEQFYTTVASDFGEPKLCRKIYPGAVDEHRPDFGTTEWRVAYKQSECYFYVALATKNPTYCDSIEPITIPQGNHSEINKALCTETIRSRSNFQYQPSAFHILDQMMTEMGYVADDALNLLYMQSSTNNPVSRFYRTINQSPQLRSKIEALPDYSEPPSEEKVRAAKEDELITELVALDYHLPALCRKLSPNAYFEIVFRQGPVGRFSLRNECFHSSAQYAHSPELCGEMTPKAALSIARNGIGMEDCQKEAATMRLHGNLGDHGSPLFFNARSFVNTLRKLGYENPVKSEGPFPNWADVYLYLVFYAGPNEKREFLRRVEALPDFTN